MYNRVNMSVSIAQELCDFFNELFPDDIAVCNTAEYNDVLIPLLQFRLWAEELGWREVYCTNDNGRLILDLDDDTWLWYTADNRLELCPKDQLWEFYGSDTVRLWEAEKDCCDEYTFDVERLDWVIHYLGETGSMDYNWNTAVSCLLGWANTGYKPTTFNRKITNAMLDIKIPLYGALAELTEYAYGYPYTDDDCDGDRLADVIGSAINNGLCHVFAKLTQAYLKTKNIHVEVLGSPSHVFIGTEDRYYDYNWPVGTMLSTLTKYPEDLLEGYDEWEHILSEFQCIPEAAWVVTEVIEKVFGTESVLWQCWKEEMKLLEKCLPQ